MAGQGLRGVRAISAAVLLVGVAGEQMKGKKSVASAALVGAGSGGAGAEHTGPIHRIVFACDAGMGSSAMGASVLRRKIQAAGFADVTVVNKAIANLTDDVDLVVTHQDLTERARQRTGSAVHVSVDNFMGSPRYDEIVELLGQTNTGTPSDASTVADSGATAVASAPVAAAAPVDAPVGNDVLVPDAVVLAGTARSRDDAITEAGRLLVEVGAVDESYVASMHEREASVSTYMGNLLAIPHGTNEAKASIRRTAMSFVRYPEHIEWNGKPTEFVVGIAGAGDDHLTLLSKLAKVFLDPADIEALRAATSAQEVLDVLDGVRA